MPDYRTQMTGKGLALQISEKNKGGQSVKQIEFSNLDVTGELRIDDAINKFLYFKNCTFEDIRFNSKGLGGLKIESSTIKAFNWYTYVEQHVELIHCTIQGVGLWGAINILSIQGCTFNKLDVRARIKK